MLTKSQQNPSGIDYFEMQPQLKIRTARPDDAAVIAGILAETFAEYISFYTPEAFTVMTPGENEIQKRFHAAGEMWVATLDGEIAGTVSAVPHKGGGGSNGNALYIRSLAILPAAQGLRIGERLLREIENYAAANKFRGLTLSTGEFLRRAVRLYERCGFIRRGVDDFYGTPLIAMEKHLD